MESESIIISFFALTTSCGVYIRLKTPSVCLSILLQTEKPWRCATTGGLAQWEQQTLAEVFWLRVGRVGRSGAEPKDQKPDYSVYQFLCVLCIQCMFVISIETGFCYPITMILNIMSYPLYGSLDIFSTNLWFIIISLSCWCWGGGDNLQKSWHFSGVETLRPLPFDSLMAFWHWERQTEANVSTKTFFRTIWGSRSAFMNT